MLGPPHSAPYSSQLEQHTCGAESEDVPTDIQHTQVRTVVPVVAHTNVMAVVVSNTSACLVFPALRSALPMCMRTASTHQRTAGMSTSCCAKDVRKRHCRQQGQPQHQQLIWMTCNTHHLRSSLLNASLSGCLMGTITTYCGGSVNICKQHGTAARCFPETEVSLQHRAFSEALMHPKLKANTYSVGNPFYTAA